MSPYELIKSEPEYENIKMLDFQLYLELVSTVERHMENPVTISYRKLAEMLTKNERSIKKSLLSLENLGLINVHTEPKKACEIKINNPHLTYEGVKNYIADIASNLSSMLIKETWIKQTTSNQKKVMADIINNTINETLSYVGLNDGDVKITQLMQKYIRCNYIYNIYNKNNLYFKYFLLQLELMYFYTSFFTLDFMGCITENENGILDAEEFFGVKTVNIQKGLISYFKKVYQYQGINLITSLQELGFDLKTVFSEAEISQMNTDMMDSCSDSCLAGFQEPTPEGFPSANKVRNSTDYSSSDNFDDELPYRKKKISEPKHEEAHVPVPAAAPAAPENRSVGASKDEHFLPITPRVNSEDTKHSEGTHNITEDIKPPKIESEDLTDNSIEDKNTPEMEKDNSRLPNSYTGLFTQMTPNEVGEVSKTSNTDYTSKKGRCQLSAVEKARPENWNSTDFFGYFCSLYKVALRKPYPQPFAKDLRSMMQRLRGKYGDELRKRIDLFFDLYRKKELKQLHITFNAFSSNKIQDRLTELLTSTDNVTVTGNCCDGSTDVRSLKIKLNGYLVATFSSSVAREVTGQLDKQLLRRIDKKLPINEDELSDTNKVIYPYVRDGIVFFNTAEGDVNIRLLEDLTKCIQRKVGN